MQERCCVVLVAPLFGGNVGAVARAIKNTGLGPLRLVAPQYEDHKEAMIFSHNAEEILIGATHYADLPSAAADCSQVVGFTVRQRFHRELTPVREFACAWIARELERDASASIGARGTRGARDAHSPGGLRSVRGRGSSRSARTAQGATGLARAPAAPRSEEPAAAGTALVFGNERDGLTNAELDHCTELVWIPSNPAHPSYNLAQAVLLAGYELFMARLAADPSVPRVQPRQTRKPPPSQIATAQELEALYQHLEAAFLAAGYAAPHTISTRMRAFREIFSRARLYRREANMLRGLARTMLRLAGRGGDGA